MKRIFTLSLLVGLLLIPSIIYGGGHSRSTNDYVALSPSMDIYSALPPVMVSSTVDPIVMLLISNSDTNLYKGYNEDYNNSTDYYGYFDPGKCYTYSDTTFSTMSCHGTNSGKVFRPSSNATNHACSGSDEWSGSFLNWLTMSHADFIRKALTGGRRGVDAASQTILERADIPNDHQWIKTPSIDVGPYTPFSGQQTFTNVGSTFSLTVDSSGNMCMGGGGTTYTYNVQVQVCDSTKGVESNCAYFSTSKAYKPEGLLQRFKERIRFGLMTYSHQSPDKGGILRRNVKYITDEVNSNGTENSSIKGIIRYINDFAGKKWDPIGEMYYEALRYFMKKGPTSEFLVSSPDDNYPVISVWDDPFSYACEQGFIIIVNDEYPSKDSDMIPGSYWYSTISDPLSIDVRGLTNTVGGVEGINSGKVGEIPADTAIGDCNINKGITSLGDVRGICLNEGKVEEDKGKGQGSFYTAGLAYYAHITDLRSDLDGKQNITTYVIALKASPDNYQGPPSPMNPLWLAAKYGGFEDIDGDNKPNLNKEWDEDNNGVPDNFILAEKGSKIEDAFLDIFMRILETKASGTGVSVLSTSGEGEGALFQAYFLPSKIEGTGGSTRRVNWLGYLHALWIDSNGNIREDSDHDLMLDDADDTDKIIKFAYNSSTNETKIERYHKRTDGSGLPQSAPYEEVPLDNLNSIWEGGKMLAKIEEDFELEKYIRNIYTFVDENEDHWCQDSKKPCLPGVGDFKLFTKGNASILKPYLMAGDDAKARDIIKFIRGGDVSGLRDRRVNVDGTDRVWKLGDIVYSTPTAVGEPMEKYHLRYMDDTYRTFYERYTDNRKTATESVKGTERETVVYVGANDGLLHAFTAGFYDKFEKKYKTADGNNGTSNGSGKAPGTELWAYIPYDLLPHLQWLTDKDYTHVYYVDLKPKVTDVQIFDCDEDHVGKNLVTNKCWGTILIGGMRLGGGELTITTTTNVDGSTSSRGHCGSMHSGGSSSGSSSTTSRTFRSSYFALDITNPAKPPRLLWRFTDNDDDGDGYGDLGFTTSYPSIAKVNNKWFMIVGSGPTDYDGNSEQKAQIFVVDLETGTLSKEFASTESSGMGCMGGSNSSTDYGKNNSFIGNTITVDLGADYKTESAYMGMTYNTNTNDNHKDNPTWKGRMLRLAMENQEDPTKWRLSVLYDTDVGEAIIAAPGASIASPSNYSSSDRYDLWIYFGTGRYYSDGDKSDTDSQGFYGIKEPCWNNSTLKWTNGCITLVSPSDLYNATNVVVYEGGGLGNSGITGVSTLDGLITTVKTNYKGWHIDFPAGSNTTPIQPSERSLNKPTILGGMVFFNTFTPGNNPCNSCGTGKLYATFFTTGTAWEESVIGLTNKSATDPTKVVLRSKDLGSGTPSNIGIHVGREKGAKAFVQVSTGEIIEVSANTTAFMIHPGLVYWKENR